MLKWLCPSQAPAASARRVLLVPDDEQWEAALRGALLSLADPDSWEDTGGVSPDDVAARWMDTFLQFLDGEECP